MTQLIPLAASSAPVPAPPARTHPAHVIRDDQEALDVADALAEEFAAGASQRDAERQLPWAEIERYSDSGLLAMTVPQNFGGAGVSAVTLAEVIARISAADGSLGQIPQSHFYMVEALRLDATEDQKRTFFTRVLFGERLGNALSEIGGKHAADYRTMLTRSSEGWTVQGRKFYCTGAIFAHWVACVAVTQERRRHVCLIPRSAVDGLAIFDDWTGFGQRTTGSGTSVFESVVVPDGNVFDHERAFERPTRMGSFAQLMHAAIDVGLARGAFKVGLAQLTRHARPYGASQIEKVTDDPHMLAGVGDLQIRLTAAEALLERAATFVDRAGADPTDASTAEASIAVAEAKIAANDVSLLLSSKLFEMAGTRSVLTHLNLDVFWRNARTHTLHDPVRWKYHFVGDYWLNGKAPPRTGTL